MHDVGNWLSGNAIGLIGLFGTLALLGVTYWYARTTKDMADIARRAAEESARATLAAERAAEAALEAARIAQSQVNVEFTARLSSTFVQDGPLVPVLIIESTGDPVVVQSVRVRRAMLEPDDESPRPPLQLVGAILSPWSNEHLLPRRLHTGEPLLMTHEGLYTGDRKLTRMLLAIDYTFSEDGTSGGTRNFAIDV